MVQLAAAVRTLGRTRSTAGGGDRSTAGANRSSRSRVGSLVRTIGTVLAITAVAYLVSRRLRSDDSPVETDSVREMAADIAPGEGQPIPIGEPGADESEVEDTDAILDDASDHEGGAESGDEVGVESGEREEDGDDTDEPFDIDETADDSSLGDVRSPEAIEQLGEEDVQEEPAEPGELTVDEEVVDDLVDETELEESDASGDGSEE